MEVDPVRGETLRVNFDVTFPSMPCSGESSFNTGGSLCGVAYSNASAGFMVLPEVRFSPAAIPAVVSLDAMDASGQHQLEIMHDVFKQRLDRWGVRGIVSYA